MSAAAAPLKLRLPDGKILEVERGTTLSEVAGQIGPGLAKAAIAGSIDGVQLDLSHPVQGGGELRFFTNRDDEALAILRHSTAHMMAQAVQRLFPGSKFGVGPVIEHGFFYDMVVSTPLKEEDLERVEGEMKKVVKEDIVIRRHERSRQEALAWAESRGDEFKTELIQDLPEDEVLSFYEQDDFTDLCRGVHVPSTGRLKHFKLLSLAGAYWRGDEKRQMMQRIYGTAFFDKKELRAHLEWREEVKKRDHRKIGKDLELFFFHPWAPASPFFLPKGAQLYNMLVEHVRGLYEEYGYQEVVTPQIFSTELWKTSGHYEHYHEDMFFCHGGKERRVEGDVHDCAEGEREPDFGLKPMNCPGHMLIFASRVRSYRELPLRIADFGRLHRFEASGATRGLTRVRSFAQDDAHIFLAPEMIPEELGRNFDMLRQLYDSLGIDFPKIALGTRPKDSVGSEELWERAEGMLRQCLDERGEDYVVNEGDGAFYGPKIDFVVHDALGRKWQLPTFQLDFNLPERFDLKYATAAGELERPVVIHRAMLGSLERFIGVYIEHTAGAFPTWIAPLQVRVLSVATDVADYGSEVAALLRADGIRVDEDVGKAKIGAKIRVGVMEKIPYLLVLGGREKASWQVAVRKRGVGDLGAMPLEDFRASLVAEISSYGVDSVQVDGA